MEEKKKKTSVKKIVKPVKKEEKKEVKVEKVTPKKVINEKVFAIVEIAKQQEKVHEGEELVVDLLQGDKFKFDKVLMYVDEKDTKFGTPYLEGSYVNATKVEDFKDKKVRVETFKAKSRFRKAIGHRQQKTRILIKDIFIK